MEILANVLSTSADGDTSSTENYAVAIEGFYNVGDNGVFVIDSMSTPVSIEYNGTSYYLYNAYFKNSAEEGDTVIGAVSGKNYTADSSSVNFSQRINNFDYSALGLSNNTNNWIITTAGADDVISNAGTGVSIFSGNGNDFVQNTNDNTYGGGIIDVGEGNDSVSNNMNYMTITAGAGDDTIINSEGGDYSTLVGGIGDDSIIIYLSNPDTIFYTEGDGNDTITGYNNGIISITSGSGYSTTTSGNDLIINVGEGSMRLVDAASITPIISGADLIDTGSGGEDTVTPADVSTVYVDLSTIGTDSGALVIDGTSSNATFKSAVGENETVVGNVANQIYTAENNLPQSINNSNSNWTINATSQNDSIYNKNYATNVSINAGDGDNYIYNDFDCHYVTMTAGGGNDTVFNGGDDGVVIMVGDGNDSVQSYGNNVTIFLGSGNDQTHGFGDGVTISGDLGDDSITLHSDYSKYNVLKYVQGDGNDTIWNYNNDDTINITSSNGYSTQTSGNDLIINVGSGSMLLVDAANVALNIVGSKLIKPEPVPTSTMHMSRWSYSFGSSASSSTLASSADLIDDNNFAYTYGNGNVIIDSANKGDVINLYDVTLDKITSAEISTGAVNIKFNDGGSLTVLGENNNSYVVGRDVWTANQQTQTWQKLS